MPSGIYPRTRLHSQIANGSRRAKRTGRIAVSVTFPEDLFNDIKEYAHKTNGTFAGTLALLAEWGLETAKDPKNE